MTVKLLDQPGRTDLTDRECANMIGGTLGALVRMTTPATLYRAVQWWAEHPELFKLLGEEAGYRGDDDLLGPTGPRASAGDEI